MTKLGFSFAPFDVNIIDHYRVLEACEGGDVRPFAIWAWIVIYVTKKKTRGSVSRAVINSALGGGDHSEATSKLVRVGLLIEGPDGRFRLHNAEKKLPKLTEDGRTPQAKRQANYMARKKAQKESAQQPTDAGAGVRNDVSTDVIPSTLSHLKSSEEVLREPSSVPRADEGLVRSDLPLLDDARAKYDLVQATKGGLETPVDAAWFHFCGHHSGNRFGGRDGILGKFQKWLYDQAERDKSARIKRREEQEREAKRDATFAARFPPKSDVAPMTPYRLVDRDAQPDPTAEELAEVRRLAAKGLPFLDAADNDAPKPTGTDQ